MENKEIEKLIELAFHEGVDETLVTLLTNDHPGTSNWKNFIDNEWEASKPFLLKKLKDIE